MKKLNTWTMFRYTTFLLFATVLLGIPRASAQMDKIYLDYSASSFEGNMPLPAEQKFIVEGEIGPTTDMVRVEVYRDLNSRRAPIYSGLWTRGQDAAASRFSVVIHQKLRGSEEYDFAFTYFRPVTDEELAYVNEQLRMQVSVYLKNQFDQGGKTAQWQEGTSRLIGDLNEIIRDALSNFSGRDGSQFEGLSDNVRTSIEAVEGQRMKFGKKDSLLAAANDKQALLDPLADQIINETKQFTHGELYYAFDKREVYKYSTEHVKNTVAINIGYGGVWFDGGVNDFNYDHAPYAGISVPFGKQAFAKPFWNNLSLSTGVFLLNFKDGDGNTVTGPVIQRPFYVGLGYKVFKFIKVQAGATILETKVEDAGFVEFDQISIRPFVGISAEFNFWMDFAK